MNVIVANKYQFMLENLGIDVIKDLKGEYDVEEIISNFQNFFYQRMILDITAIKNYRDIRNLQKLSISLDMDKVILLLDGTADTTSPTFISQLISMGIYNFARNVDDIQYLYNSPHTYRDVAQFHLIGDGGNVVSPTPQSNITRTNNYDQPGVRVTSARVIGFRNMSKHAGATTLIYILKKALQQKYDVVAIEVDRVDFNYFKDTGMISVPANEVSTTINNNGDKDIILLDVNASEIAMGLCNEIIYLLEPSTIKINKMLTVNPTLLPKMRDKKIVLNQSLLSPTDVSEFQSEAGVKIYYNMPPLNERERNNEKVLDFLSKLGIGI